MTIIEIIQLILVCFILVVLLRRHPLASNKAGRGGHKIILDSCALIDGRIIAITEAGFGAEELIIPRFIIEELQLLADGNDSHKRERARFGLDVAKRLQADETLRVQIDMTTFPDIPKTDDKLIALAQKLHGQLYTTDFNLGKVAVLAGVRVLNVNELAQSLRPELLPGERKMIKIIQKGQGRNQGVGYLDDGTMVVVDNALKLQGTIREVVIERMHQTVAGKMAFAHLAQAEGEKQPITTPRRRTNR